ncbi:MAG: transposase [Deltaproteobacteria bacterium]|nr:transposase [Deltaproteobacteria bacterium]
MSEIRRRSDREFRGGAVRIVTETGKLIAHAARDLDIHPGTLGNWCRRSGVAAGGG